LTALAESARICEIYSKTADIPRLISRTRTATLYRWAGRSLMTENPKAALEAVTHALRLQPLSPKNIGLWTRLFFRQKTRRSRTAKSLPSNTTR